MRRGPRPRPQRYLAGPWRGMRRHVATATDRKDFAEELRNMYLRDTDMAPVAVGRPGFDVIGSQLGTGGGRVGQLVIQFTTQAGVEHSIAICGGVIHEYDWGGDTFSNPVTAANLVTAGVTLSASARCYGVVFANKLIISDGVNKPFAWDGTTGAGGVTPLSNAPVLYGQPWVYNGRLWGIKGSSTATRISVTWSEVGTPNTGYEAGGYLNIWDVAQTQQTIFYAGASTNDSMVLCRANSATRITGADTANFQSTANREGVHEFVGSVSPGGMVVHQDTVYFFSNDGRIMRVQPGGVATEIAPGLREFVSLTNPATFTVVEGFVWDAGTSGEYLCWTITGPGSVLEDTTLVVDPRSEELVGLWTGWAQDRIGVWKDAAGEPVLVHLGGSAAAQTAEGYAYVHGKPTSGPWSDGFEDGDQPISNSVQTHAMGFDEITEKYWDIGDLSLLPEQDSITTLTVETETPYGPSEPVATEIVGGGGARLDVAVFDTGTFGRPASETKVAIGLDVVGRWCKLQVSHTVADEPFAIETIQVRAVEGTEAPDIL